jgi:hypothetical protein
LQTLTPAFEDAVKSAREAALVLVHQFHCRDNRK